MDNMMQYKGYFAEIKYSDEDECFIGRVEGLKNDTILFEGQTVKELKKDFKDAINSYLDTCKKTNTEPEKQCKGSFNIRIKPNLHRDLVLEAKKEKISLNQLVERFLMEKMKEI
ncbi:MAG: type II toxin-antitoxin system HicB family antitoxin [Clostridia bacterium]|nr:type II toxin-antitoxin system HicB family antitoxin [Clostridia bacterium]